MTNLVYQTAIEELEAVLSPRVVSRSLKEGLRQHGRSPDSVDVATLEQILKGQVYRQLQVSMPVTEAKSTVESIVGKLREVGVDGDGADEPRSVLQSQGERIAALQEALRPFNLYFEWPEVQKLRAQLQLLESEHQSGREAAGLVADAETQLQVVEQKLEDQLVLQAREVGELAEALEVVRSLGGPKIRRLESLVNHMRSAQESRQLAPAELERARKLARDLRKLMESSVYSETQEDDQPHAAQAPADPEPEHLPPHSPDDGVYDVESEDEEILAIDMQNLTPEASERLRLIDLAAEAQDLAALRDEHADLLDYRPDLAERVQALEGEAAAGRSIAAELSELRGALSDGVVSVRESLQAELEQLSGSLEDLADGVDASELRQAVTVAIGILSSSLPAAADVEHVRQLHRLVEEQAEAQRRADEALAAQLRSQEELVNRLEETLVRYESHSPSEDVERLRSELESLRIAQATRTIVPEVMASVRQAEERLVRDLAERATEATERRRARLEAIRAQLLSFPATKTMSDRLDAAHREIARLLEDQAGTEAASALLIDDPLPHMPTEDGGDDLDALESLVASLKTEALSSARRRLEQLGEQASDVGSVRFAERLAGAVADLERGVFPDLVGIEADMGRARESARIEQMGELHRLGREAQTYAGLDDPKVRELTALLEAEKDRLNQGGHARRLGEAAVLLDGIEARFDERIAGVPDRIDAALERFEHVAKLNSDDVATVRRVLTHLDSQRASLGRVSVGLRQQLEASLSQAEMLLGNLEEEYEATRLIADQLVSEGLLDDVLGALGGGDEGEAGATPPAGGVSAGELVERYSDTPGVTSVVVFSASGERLAAAGEPPEQTGWTGLAALRDAAMGFVAHGEEPPAGGPLVVTAGIDSAHVVVAYGAEVVVSLTVDSPALAPVVSGRLRRDLAGD